MSIMSQRHTHLWVKTIKHVVLTDGHIEVNPCHNLLGLFSHQVPVHKICLFLLRIGWLVTFNFVSQNTSVFFVNKCLKWKVCKFEKLELDTSGQQQVFPLTKQLSAELTFLFWFTHNPTNNNFGSHTIPKQFQVPLTSEFVPSLKSQCDPAVCHWHTHVSVKTGWAC